MVLAVNVANSALVAVVHGSYLEQTRWWIFFGLVITLTGLRAIGWICYRHYRQAYETTAKWAIIATAGSALSGLLWGLGGSSLLSDNILEQTFLDRDRNDGHQNDGRHQKDRIEQRHISADGAGSAPRGKRSEQMNQH